MTVPTRQAILVPHLATSILGLIAQAHRVVAGIGGHPQYFATPTPPLADITAAANALDATNTAYSTHSGTIEDRNAAEATLRALLKRCAGYVQGVADADPPNASAIIAAAGFDEKAAGSHPKRDWAVNDGPHSGSVVLTAPAAPRGKTAFWEWRHTVDSGKTYVTDPTTNAGKLTLENLPVGVRVEFQYRMTVQHVTGDWSSSIALVIR